ncbi:MAG TPA: polysaccharide deacetylase family protein, partial [Conexibacter sp.]|nr:polysaccharide deacetylase family protein [Conexibacter sp.]
AGRLGSLSAMRALPRRAFPLLLAAALAALALGAAACGNSGHAPTVTADRAAAPHARAPRRAATHPALVAPAHPVARTLRVPILMYHRVHLYATELTKSLPDLTVEPAVFAAEVAALARAGYHSVTVAQLFGALFHGAPLPPKPVMLSFDDGYVDDVTQVLPVLRANHMTGVFFIITGRFHEAGFVDEAQVRQLDAAGMDVGAHTRHHVDLPGLPAATLQSEIAGSRTDLERVLHHPVAAFAYPAGRFDAASVAAVRQAGFALAVTTQPGMDLSSRQPLLLPRVRVGRATTPAGLLSCLAGAGC